MTYLAKHFEKKKKKNIGFIHGILSCNFEKSYAVFLIRIRFHANPDPGSQKCPYGSGSRPLIFYSDPDPKGVKIKENKERKQIFNLIFQNDIKTPLKISKHKGLKTDPYFYVSIFVFT